jgi:hypothetical protein
MIFKAQFWANLTGLGGQLVIMVSSYLTSLAYDKPVSLV